MNFLQGYRTYIVGVLIVLIGLTEGLLGFDVPGVSVGDDWIVYVLNGAGLSTLRLAVGRR